MLQLSLTWLQGDAFPAHPLDFSVKSEPSELMFAQDMGIVHKWLDYGALRWFRA